VNSTQVEISVSDDGAGIDVEKVMAAAGKRGLVALNTSDQLNEAAALALVDAFTALRADRFDLVVSDVEMPRMNGFDLTARIRADRTLAEVPVVLVTALESREDRERGIDVGANAYLVKSSLDQSNLLVALRRLA
jgi:CheY-like chemotaxis protein